MLLDIDVGLDLQLQFHIPGIGTNEIYNRPPLVAINVNESTKENPSNLGNVPSSLRPLPPSNKIINSRKWWRYYFHGDFTALPDPWRKCSRRILVADRPTQILGFFDHCPCALHVMSDNYVGNFPAAALDERTLRYPVLARYGRVSATLIMNLEQETKVF
jgi:hypothetical protein